MGLRMDRLNKIIQLLSSCENVYVVIGKKEKLKVVFINGTLKSFTKNCNGEIEIFLEGEFKYYIPISEVTDISRLNQIIVLQSEKADVIFKILQG